MTPPSLIPSAFAPGFVPGLGVLAPAELALTEVVLRPIALTFTA
jgi:hypothetical protein